MRRHSRAGRREKTTSTRAASPVSTNFAGWNPRDTIAKYGRKGHDESQPRGSTAEAAIATETLGCREIRS